MKNELGVGFYLAWLSTRNSCKWSPCMLILIWHYPYDIIDFNWPSWDHVDHSLLLVRADEMHCVQVIQIHSLPIFPFSLLHSMARICFCLSLRKDWKTCWKACVTPCLCQIWAWCLWEGGAGGWWWACRHAQTWSSPLSANLGRAELVKHTRARSPAQLPRHAHTHSD